MLETPTFAATARLDAAISYMLGQGHNLDTGRIEELAGPSPSPTPPSFSSASRDGPPTPTGP